MEFFVEGMVPVALLRDDYYQYREKEHLLVGSRSGLRFRIGDPLRVQVSRVDLERRRIEFVPAGSAGAPFHAHPVGTGENRKRILAAVQAHRGGTTGGKKGKSPHGRRRRG